MEFMFRKKGKIWKGKSQDQMQGECEVFIRSLKRHGWQAGTSHSTAALSSPTPDYYNHQQRWCPATSETTNWQVLAKCQRMELESRTSAFSFRRHFSILRPSPLSRPGQNITGIHSTASWQRGQTRLWFWCCRKKRLKCHRHQHAAAHWCLYRSRPLSRPRRTPY